MTPVGRRRKLHAIFSDGAEVVFETTSYPNGGSGVDSWSSGMPNAAMFLATYIADAESGEVLKNKTGHRFIPPICAQEVDKQWLYDNGYAKDFAHFVKMFGGGGSGKSSFMNSMITKLSSETEKFPKITILKPRSDQKYVHYFDLEGSFDKKFKNYITDKTHDCPICDAQATKQGAQLHVTP